MNFSRFFMFEFGQISLPDRRPLLQPTLPVRAPENLLNKLFCVHGAMRSKYGGYDLLFRDNPVADIGREHRDIVALLRAVIETALIGVMPTGVWQELFERG